MIDRDAGEPVTVRAAAADRRRPALRRIGRERERAQRHRVREPPPHSRVLARADDPGLTCRLVLIIVTGGADSEECALTLFVPTLPADDNRIRDHRAVGPRRTAAPALVRNALLVVDRSTRRARDVGILNRRARIVDREGTPDRTAGHVTAADDRLVTIIGLFKHHGERAARDRGRDPLPTVINHLGADRTRRKHPRHERTVIGQPRLTGR